MQMNEIRVLIGELAGDEYLYFDEPFELWVKDKGRCMLSVWYGACAAPDGSLHLMSAFQDWEELPSVISDAPDAAEKLLSFLKELKTKYSSIKF